MVCAMPNTQPAVIDRSTLAIAKDVSVIYVHNL